MGSHEGLCQPDVFYPNGLLSDEAASVTRVLDLERWSIAEERIAELIGSIQPNKPSEDKRNAVANYVQHLITKCFSCQMPSVYGSRLTTFEDSEKESEYGYVRKVGRERHSTFCLMQKYVDLQSMGKKPQIVTAFAAEHVEGAIFIEAYKKNDIYEACNGLCSIYPSRVAAVKPSEIYNLLSVRSKPCTIIVGTFARVKSGKYKGDLAKVVAVNESKRKATVKLICDCPFFQKTVVKANAAVQEKELDVLIVFLKVDDANVGRYAKEGCDANS